MRPPPLAWYQENYNSRGDGTVGYRMCIYRISRWVCQGVRSVAHYFSSALTIVLPPEIWNRGEVAGFEKCWIQQCLMGIWLVLRLVLGLVFA
jgi:hypothetical protein